MAAVRGRRPDHGRLPPELPPRWLPRGAPPRDHVADQRRACHQGRVVLRAHLRSADGRRRRGGEPRPRLGVGQGGVRRGRHRVLRPVLVRGIRVRPDLGRHRARPRSVQHQPQHQSRRHHQGLGPGLRRPRRVRDRAVHHPGQLRQRAQGRAGTAGVGQVQGQVPRGRWHRGPGTVVDHRQGLPADLNRMGAHNLASTLMIRLDLLNPSTLVYERVDLRLARLTEGFGGATGSRYSADFFPLGVWGTPQNPGTPIQPLPSGDVVSAGKQVVLVAGVDMPGVGPDIDYFQVRANRRPLPLLATGNDRKSFLKVSGTLPTVDASTATEALTLAAGQMFADRTVAGTMTARGGHSALAQAAFVQDRSAPPMFGTLTDGLAPINGESGAREVLPATSPFEARLLREPFVAGYLTGGVGDAVRPGATTVADGRLKRRPAPSVDSVQGRLALHLPVSLSRAAVPAVASAGTLIASGAVPRTDAPGSMRSFTGGRIGSSALQGLVSGLAGASGPGPQKSSALPM